MPAAARCLALAGAPRVVTEVVAVAGCALAPGPRLILIPAEGGANRSTKWRGVVYCEIVERRANSYGAPLHGRRAGTRPGKHMVETRGSEVYPAFIALFERKSYI